MVQTLENIVAFLNNNLTYVLIVGLLAGGLFFTIKMGFVQFRMIGEMFRLLTDGRANSNGKKGVSSFQAFAMSTASRVGTGNLAGVATAVVFGGPGAVFWMWLIALLGSASSFVESTLAQIYKTKNGDTFKGGPAYYMEKALRNRKLGVTFAILITICFGFVFNALQANTIAGAFENAYSFNPMFMGFILAAASGIIIFGGVQRIAKISAIIVPIMAVLYLLVALFVVVSNITELPAVLALIVKSAFGFEEFAGGTLGATIMIGIKRGLFSNEAGMGSAPNAAATADVSHPVKQGLIQTLGVFTDTLIICTATALIVLVSGDFTSGAEGIQLVQNSLATEIGAWAPSFISICILLFAFTSIIGNYYYGEANIQYISDNKNWLVGYRILVVGMVIFGSIASISLVWNLADVFMTFMALLNIYAIFRLAPIAQAALKDYMMQRKKGLDPVFYRDSIEGIEEGAECWPTREEAKRSA